MIIGSHVSMKGKDMLYGAVKEALSYEANTFMFYTGAPQNTYRKPIQQLKIDEAKALMHENNIDIDKVVVHAPYIINLANSIKSETFDLAVRFLKEEIDRCEAIGISRMVLHPGSHVKAGEQVGLDKIVEGLNMVLEPNQHVHIALETMAGKGSELGYCLDQLKYIIEHTKYNELLGVTIDTCHMHDAGYNLTKFDDILAEFDELIGIDKILVVHVNDSKNPMGSHKDRHENIGYGYIGFDTLNTIVHHPLLKDVPKILETPYIDEHAPYKEEIDMFRKQKFNDTLK
ncbi:MAG: deoxyribonuclease IV [Erysipelotrichaceae bacterium]|nr:deoxyribonuclease IV [Erysipelotrichaceae bacterium]